MIRFTRCDLERLARRRSYPRLPSGIHEDQVAVGGALADPVGEGAAEQVDGVPGDGGQGLTAVGRKLPTRRSTITAGRFSASVVERFVLFGEDLGRDDRSCMDSPAR
jgi:hypothetical protein